MNKPNGTQYWTSDLLAPCYNIFLIPPHYSLSLAFFSVMMIMMLSRGAALEPAQPTVEWQISVHSVRAVVRPARNQQLSQELVMGPGHWRSNRGHPHFYKMQPGEWVEQSRQTACDASARAWCGSLTGVREGKRLFEGGAFQWLSGEAWNTHNPAARQCSVTICTGQERSYYLTRKEERWAVVWELRLQLWLGWLYHLP